VTEKGISYILPHLRPARLCQNDVTMSFVLGIDGGGSKTTAAVSDGVYVLATHTASGCNLNSVAPSDAQSALAEAVHGALNSAGVSAADVTNVCAGVAGAASPETAAKIAEMIAALLPRAEVQIAGDTAIALDAEFRGGSGVVCISGTGSIAFGRNERGDLARAGGWGRFVSDEGSGHWIGQCTVAECLHALDMGRSSSLIAGIMHHWHIATREQLVQHCNRDQIPNFSDLVPVVLKAEKDGDALACDILTTAGTRLARVAQIVLRRLWVGRSPVEVVITGGVFMNSTRVRQIFSNVIRSDRPEVSIRLSEREPYMGAIYLAHQRAQGASK
jgi:N-acetylglucosamine kinase-like BadF-type ATPase